MSCGEACVLGSNVSDVNLSDRSCRCFVKVALVRRVRRRFCVVGHLWAAPCGAVAAQVMRCPHSGL